jgi:hypothetical protein
MRVSFDGACRLIGACAPSRWCQEIRQMHPRPPRYALPALILTLACVTAPLAAQAPPTSKALEPVITVGSSDELRQNEDAARDAEVDAARAVDEARTNKSQSEARLDIAKSQLETIKKSLDLARKEKREGDRLELERQKGAQEVRIKLLERSRAVRNDEIGVEEARRDVARAELKLVAAERDLVARRAALSEADSLAPLTRMSDDVAKATRTAIERRKDVAEARKKLAEKERSLADEQLKLLDAQLAVKSLEG